MAREFLNVIVNEDPHWVSPSTQELVQLVEFKRRSNSLMLVTRTGADGSRLSHKHIHVDRLNRRGVADGRA